MEQKQLLNIEDGSKDKKYFTIIPNYILNHSTAMDQALYCQMKRLTEEEGKDICYPSVSYLMKQLKSGKQSIRKSIEYLMEHKWIEDKGKRRVKTKGGYQWVQCYKVNDIWKFNMDYYQKEQGGSEQTYPTENKGGLEISKGGLKSDKGGLVVSPKEEPLKKEHIKEEHLAMPSIAGNDINLLIELFKPINPTYERFFKNKTERASLENLVKKFGQEKVENVIKTLPKIFGKKYAPRIVSPYQLETKLADLIAYLKAEESTKKIIFKI